ncbi:Alpha/Beta hydrolase protein [Xylogone sp. PMI_703]|nr:Alpha/Beta hydrolase protein [Xylogone sp. PMI_703]
MEQLPPLGRVIPLVIGQTSQIYGDLLAKHAEAIRATARETHSYGSHERQQLDLYTPSSSAPKPAHGQPAPILIFAYGGGFINGDKVLERMPGGLAYTNLGHYFAEKYGFETIIPDYRLVRHGGKFPSGGEDIGLVLEWVRKRYAGQKGKKVIVMGNSAGGVHVATWLLSDQFKDTRERLIAGSDGIKVAGVILLGGGLHFRLASPPLVEVLKQYFGDDYEDKAPFGLLEKAIQRGELKGEWPKTLVLYSELDPQDIIQANIDFIEELGKHRKDLTHGVIRGHNHISPPLALGTGIETEEEWGTTVGAWVQSLL